jgi:acylphosphatase
VGILDRLRPPRQRLTARAHGRVQGVGFRVFTRREAERLGLSGHVRNEPDGTVSVVAEGPRQRLETLLAALHRGPRNARVERVDEVWGPAEGGLDGFHVAR